MPRPIFAYLGRVAVEKNIAAFLDLDLPGTKVVIGDGPDRSMLESRYSSAVFLGFKFGVELAQALSSADVFVFPSRTDTFGLVMLEAMACGTPVAAYPVTGPIDVVRIGVTGVLDDDLGCAARAALAMNREGCRRAASEWTWERASKEFFGHLVRARDGQDLTARVAAPADQERLTASVECASTSRLSYARMPFGVWRSSQGSFEKSRWNATLRSRANVAAGNRAGADHQRVGRRASGVVSLRITGFASLCRAHRAHGV